MRQARPHGLGLGLVSLVNWTHFPKVVCLLAVMRRARNVLNTTFTLFLFQWSRFTIL